MKYGEFVIEWLEAVDNVIGMSPPTVQETWHLLLKEMSFASRPDGGMKAILDDRMKRLLCRKREWRSVQNALYELKNKGLIRKVAKDVYQISPWYAYKGEASFIDEARRLWDSRFKAL